MSTHRHPPGRARRNLGLVGVLLGLTVATCAVAGVVGPAAVVSGHAAVSSARVEYRHFPVAQGRSVYAQWRPDDVTPDAADTPWVVYVHGGSWRAGSAEESTSRQFCAHQASQGRACFSVEYRLVPHVSWPTPLLDVQDDLRWVYQHAPEFGLDPARGAIVGISAGALMSSIAGLDEPRIRGIVSLSGATDVAWVREHDEGTRLAVDAATLVRDRSDSSALTRSASVEERARTATTCPAFLIIHERDDPEVPVGASDDLAAALGRLGFPVTYARTAGNQHQSVANTSSDPNTRTLDAWLTSTLAGPRPACLQPAGIHLGG